MLLNFDATLIIYKKYPLELTIYIEWTNPIHGVRHIFVIGCVGSTPTVECVQCRVIITKIRYGLI